MVNQSETEDGAQTKYSRVWVWLFRVSGILILLVASAVVLEPTTPLARGLSLAGIGLVVLVFGFLRDLRKLTISVAKIVEVSADVSQAREAAADARIAALELRQLAKMLGGELMQLIVGANRYGGSHTSEEEFDRVTHLQNFLSEIGLSVQEISDINRGVSELVAADYCSVISDLVDDMRPARENSVWNEFWAPWHENGQRPSPDVLKAFLSKHGWINNDVLEWLEDYRYYQENIKHRRPQSFRTRGQLQKQLRRQRSK